MKNYKNKIENFCLAATRLNEAITIYRQEPENTLLQDGLIQRFEFTFELAWKSLKDYLIDQGVAPSLTFPKEILKEAYAAKNAPPSIRSSTTNCSNLYSSPGTRNLSSI